MSRPVGAVRIYSADHDVPAALDFNGGGDSELLVASAHAALLAHGDQ